MIFFGQEYEEFETPELIFFADVHNYPFRLSEKYFYCGFITQTDGYINYHKSVNSVRIGYTNNITIFPSREKWFTDNKLPILSKGQYIVL